MSITRSFILLVIVLGMIGSLAIMPLPVQGRTASPTIQQIQNNPNAYIGQTVTIRGTVGRYIDRNEFLLDDGTGQIVVDLDLPRNRRITIPTGTTVTVTGEIDRMRGGGVDLDACRIETPTEVIQIEECDYSPSAPAPSSTPTSNPPSANSPTIGQIQSNPNAYLFQTVTIRGTVGRYIDRNEFLLDDGTGQIVVDLDLPRNRRITIPTGTTVTVTGEIDRMRGGGVDLDACRIETPTEVIQISECNVGANTTAPAPTPTSNPTSSNSPTIGQIQSNPNAYIDQIVTISGTVGRYVDRNEFLLDDGTGQIVVDPGPPWYRQITIPTGTRITVIGQIDWMRGGGVDLDACRIETPTETIQIRDCSFNGPPPWAGGPRGRGRP